MIELVTAAERLAGPKRKVSIAIAGRAKVGKTSLLLTLPEAETIALDSEAGLNAIEGLWHGDSIPLRSWTDTVNIACLLGGPTRPRRRTRRSLKHIMTTLLASPAASR